MDDLENTTIPPEGKELVVESGITEGLISKTEMPLGTSFSFASEESAKSFVIKFWEELDKVRNQKFAGRNQSLNVSPRFVSGMWKPDQIVTDGCRTQLIEVSKKDKALGAVATVFVSANYGPPPRDAAQALNNLGA